MKLKNVKFTGGVDGGRSWTGDVKNMLLDINKFKVLGRGPKLNSQQAIRKTAKEIIQKQPSVQGSTTDFCSHHKFKKV